ncbi:MAG: septal ring lytic transglycosylase RlpA family lipoprotein [Micavibrio aeruginosavorus]|uniref:Septal ring lytic transglycosylase RlpA family lipoprotein n=1 Tax=Micavibrio aeruginosavorus TaxID=349221 RepID=A0A2W4ZMZ1_9BACT|nr:MAG: septal ring lytic transglycosylase RlpA family lipoprotein [Micavibrio aeruginosavorus]
MIIGGKLSRAFALACGMSVAGVAQAQECKLIQTGTASWYGEEMARGKKNGKRHYNKTASGDEFVPGGISAAHKTLRLNSEICVVAHGYNTKTMVEINDRGPFAKGRILDASRGLAERLGFKDDGEAKVSLYANCCPN